MKLVKARYTRTSVRKDPDRLYIFTDNCDRSSGRYSVPDDSEYSKRFGKTGLNFPTTTSAIIRGLPNAYPITTKKAYKKGCKSYGLWTEDDIEEFKKVIDEDIEHIKKACIEKGYKIIVFPCNGLLNTKLSKISFERTPSLFNYILEKEIELKNFKEK